MASHEAMRMRRYRRRLAAGQQVAFVNYNDEVIDNLVAARLLDPDDIGDAKKVAEALEKMARTML